MRILAALAVVALLGRFAHADDDEPPTVPRPPLPEPAPPPERNVQVAFLVPFSTTAVGLALVLSSGDKFDEHQWRRGIGVGAMIVGPTLGRLYARDPSWFGLGVEVAGVGIATMALINRDELAEVELAAAAGIYGIGALYQIISAPIVVNRANQERRAMLLPTADANGVGLSIAGAF